jgi:hypothetical protein
MIFSSLACQGRGIARIGAYQATRLTTGPNRANTGPFCRWPNGAGQSQTEVTQQICHGRTELPPGVNDLGVD